MKRTVFTLMFMALFALSTSSVSAHCDTIDGPVVKAAAFALEKGNIDPVLKWVKKEYEAEVRAAFRQALDVRALNTNAKALADTYFFETVVRVHRAGEGEPYTGLKPAGTPIEPVILAADRALETGNVDELSRHITAQIAENIEHRFAAAAGAKKDADKSIDAGRKYVQAYVEYVHYLEQMHQQPAAHHSAAGHEPTPASEHDH